MTEKPKFPTGALLGFLFNLTMLGLLTVLAFTRDGAEGAAWTVGIFAYLILLKVEGLERRLANPIYSVYIETETTDGLTEKVKAALDKSPYKK